jgi:Domain of unknown function (DUF4747)
MIRFYFSRISVVADRGSLDKAQFLYEGLNSKAEVVYRRDTFKFINSEVLKIGSKVYVTGQLVKYIPDHEESVVSKTNEIEHIPIKNKILAASRFFIDTAASIIMYEENKSHIPKDSFGARFKSLFVKNFSEEFADIEISAITEDYDFFKRIDEVKEIKRIVINLVPSNPNNSQLWKRVDEKLRNDKITNYKEIQENKKKGQSIKVDEETKSKFYMSEDGYGKSDVSGLDANGKEIFVSTEDSTTHAKHELPKEVTAPEAQIQMLREKLSEISSRTNEAK